MITIKLNESEEDSNFVKIEENPFTEEKDKLYCEDWSGNVIATETLLLHSCTHESNNPASG